MLDRFGQGEGHVAGHVLVLPPDRPAVGGPAGLHLLLDEAGDAPGLGTLVGLDEGADAAGAAAGVGPQILVLAAPLRRYPGDDLLGHLEDPRARAEVHVQRAAGAPAGGREVPLEPKDVLETGPPPGIDVLVGV